jgi:hypothetical protein
VVNQFHESAIKNASLQSWSLHLYGCANMVKGMKPSLCPVKSRLLNAYEEASASHSAAVTTLRARMGVLTQPEYEAEYASTEVLRMEAREALERLNRHVAEHGC